MEAISFSFKDLLVSLLFFFSTCQLSEPTSIHGNSSQPTNLTMPKDEGGEDYSNVSTKLTLILLENEKFYAFEGNDLNNGDLYEKQALKNIVQKSQKKFPGKDFIVLIKPTNNAAYSLTVDVLDEMTINKIKKYAIVELNNDERHFIDLVRKK